MRNGHRIVVAVATIGLLASWLVSCGSRSGSLEGAHGEAEEQVAKGPHGGRLLEDGDFAVEVTIYERGVPPEFRVYAFEQGKRVDPADAKLRITLRRLGGRVDEIGFAPVDGYLRGDRTVDEPHSFDVAVTAEHGGRTYQWQYPSYEGRTELSPAAVANAGISIETVGPATIRTMIRANGRIVPNEDHLAHVIPRYPGVVKVLRKRLGDTVGAGEVVAVVEGNQSLQSYDIKSPLDGTVIGKDATTGEFLREGEAIYTIANLGTVWADLNVYPRDFDKLRVGQPVSIDGGRGIARAQGTLVYLSPIGAENTQTLVARAAIENPEGRWRPGLFVTGQILVEEAAVPTAVKASALQRFRDWDVVFLNDGSVFQAMPITLGRRDAESVEAVEGVEPGQRYAADNSFIVKADVGKSGATHDH